MQNFFSADAGELQTQRSNARETGSTPPNCGKEWDCLLKDPIYLGRYEPHPKTFQMNPAHPPVWNPNIPSANLLEQEPNDTLRQEPPHWTANENLTEITTENLKENERFNSNYEPTFTLIYPLTSNSESENENFNENFDNQENPNNNTLFNLNKHSLFNKTKSQRTRKNKQISKKMGRMVREIIRSINNGNVNRPINIKRKRNKKNKRKDQRNETIIRPNYIQETIEYSPRQKELWKALRYYDDEKTKESLINIINEPTEIQEFLVNENTSLEELLLNCPTDKWPIPKNNACPYVGCEFVGLTKGNLRNHLRKVHKQTKTYDPIQIAIFNLASFEILLQTEDGIDFEHSCCHYPNCNYFSQRWKDISKHEERHNKYVEKIKVLGLFWATIKIYIKELNRYPTIKELIGPQYAYKCEHCKSLISTLTNFKTHYAMTHNIRPSLNSVQKIIIITKLADNNKNRDDEEENTEPPPPPRRAEPNNNTPNNNQEELIYLKQREININPNINEILNNTCLKDEILNEIYNDKNAFESLWLTINDLENSEIFYYALLKLRFANKSTSNKLMITPSINDKITEALINLNPDYWPDITCRKECCNCKATFTLQQSLIEHLHTHNDQLLNEDFNIGWLQHAYQRKINGIIIDEIGNIINNNAQLFKCKVYNCKFISTKKEDLENHLMLNEDETHVIYKKYVKDYGPFYGAIKAFIKCAKRIPTIAELLGDNRNRTRWCNICFKCIPKSRKAILEHLQKHNINPDIDKAEETSFTILYAHTFQEINNNNPNNEIENRIREDINKLRNWSRPQPTDIDFDKAVDKAYIEALRNESSSEDEEERKIINEIRNNHMRIDPESIQVNNENNINKTLENQIQTINKQRKSHKARDLLTEDIPNPPEIQQWENINNNDTMIKAKRALKWYEEYLERKDLIVKIPRINQKERNKVKEGLKDLFNREIIPMIDEYQPETLAAALDEEELWMALEGVIEKCMDLIRKHIMIKCNRNPNKIYSKFTPKRITNINKEQIIMLQYKIKNFKQIDIMLKELINLNKNDLTVEEQNKFNNTVNKLAKYVNKLTNEQKLNYFNTIDMNQIMELIINDINTDNNTAKWIEYEIIQAIEEEQKIKCPNSIKEHIRNEYIDNPEKVLKNIICKKESPRCGIEMERLENYFTELFEKERIIFNEDNEGIFKLNKAIPDNIDNEIMEELINEELISKVITTRKWKSAPGPDGVDYTIFKLANKESTTFLTKIFKWIIKFQKIPSSWKTSELKLIYKKGDMNEPRNWRPIAIANSIYRIFSCTIAKIIMKLNNHYQIFSEEQKGFIENRDGCFQNAIAIQELLADAQRHNKQLLVTTLDFRNAFGSVPHDLIKTVLKQKGFPDSFINIIMNCYQDGTTRITTPNGISSHINIKIGTKQGCPMSPLLFNLCLEPLINFIKNYYKELGYPIKDKNENKEYFTIQLYADDIILISKNENDMQQLIKAAQTFCNYSLMRLEPSKCKVFTYLINNRRRVTSNKQFILYNEPIPVATMNEAIIYLGAPITIRKNNKLKTVTTKIEQVKAQIIQIIQSNLLITQKIHALKTFVLPKLDYSFICNQPPIKELQKLDSFIRQSFNNIFKVKIPLQCYHANWKDGGLSIPNLELKNYSTIVKSFLKILLLPKNDKLRKLIKVSIRDERIKRRINEQGQNENNYFLNWCEINENSRSGTNCLAYRTLNAAKRLNISIKKIKNNIIIKDLNTSYKKECDNYNAVANFINTIIKRRWQESIDASTLHLHGFHSLKNAPYSNGFIINMRRPVDDKLFTFAFKARTNSLPTPANIELYNNVPHKNCTICEQSNIYASVSLLHILNKCITSRQLINTRHNKISTILREQIRKSWNIEDILENKNVPLENLTDRAKNLRPDMIILSENRQKMTIIEITCPYANYSNNQSTLETAYYNKKAKYNNLIEEIRENNINVEFIVIVISSLYGIYKESWKDIQRMFPARKTQAKLAHRLVSNTLFGSAKIWWNRCRNIERNEEEDNEEGNNEEEETREENDDISLIEDLEEYDRPFY